MVRMFGKYCSVLTMKNWDVDIYKVINKVIYVVKKQIQNDNNEVFTEDQECINNTYYDICHSGMLSEIFKIHNEGVDLTPYVLQLIF